MEKQFKNGFTIVEIVCSLAIASVIGGVSVGAYFYSKEEEKKKEYANIDDFFQNADNSVIKFDTPTNKGDSNSCYDDSTFTGSTYDNRWKGKYIVNNVTEGITIQRTIDTPDVNGYGKYQDLSEAFVSSIPIDVLTGVIISYITTLAGNQLGSTCDFFAKNDEKDQETTGNYFCVNYSSILKSNIYKVGNDPKFKEKKMNEIKEPDAEYSLSKKASKLFNGRGLILHDEMDFEWEEEDNVKVEEFEEEEDDDEYKKEEHIYTDISKKPVIENKLVKSKVVILVKRIGYISENKTLKIISLAKK